MISASTSRRFVRQFTTLVLAIAMATALAVERADATSWLDRTNSFRDTASIPRVEEEPVWSSGCYLHARYMALNDIIEHREIEGMPWYSEAGDLAAHKSNLYLGVSGIAAIDGWMVTPFHGIGMIDPQLTRVGFGSYSAGGREAAALDVIRGIDWDVQPTYPIMFPANGAVMPLFSFSGGEYPDPLWGSGYVGPVGPSIFLQTGPGDTDPVVAHSSFRQGDRELEHITLSETSYRHSDPEQQQLGRAVLGSRDAVVLIPRYPLARGTKYDVELTCNGMTYSWSFTTAGRGPNPAWLSTPVAASTMVRNRYYSVAGYLKPQHTHGSRAVRVYRYHYEDGTWWNYGFVAATVSDYADYSRYRAVISLPKRGRWRLRAYHADAVHTSSWSGGFKYVTVR